MKKILYIATAPLGYEGITNVMLNYINNLASTKVTIDVVSTNGIDSWVKKEIELKGGSVFEIDTRNNNPIKYIKEIIEINKEHKYDILHVHGNSGTMTVDILAGLFSKIPTRIAHSHNTTSNYKWIHYMLKPLLSKISTTRLASSQDAGKWCFTNDFEVINNGINTENFLFNRNIRDVYRERLGIKNKFVIAHIGHMTYQKNHEFLLNIFNELFKKDSNVQLLLIGDGRNKEKILKQAEELNLLEEILFLGKRDDVNKLMQAVDVFVLPSRYEGLGIVNIEAQAAGLKCFVSDRVPLEAKVSENLYFKSLEENPQNWADAILNYKNYQRIDMRKEIFDAKYDVTQTIHHLESIYFGN